MSTVDSLKALVMRVNIAKIKNELLTMEHEYLMEAINEPSNTNILKCDIAEKIFEELYKKLDEMNEEGSED